MKSGRTRDGRNFTRREAIGLGLLLGTGVSIAGVEAGATLAQGVPAASPTSGQAYAHPKMLTDAAELTGGLGDRALSVVGFVPAEEYAKRHIPGAVQLDWPALEVTDTSEKSMMNWSERIGPMLAGRGVAPDRAVVTYDAGTLFSARLWWVLHYLGHGEKRVLNGGIAAWQQAGGTVDGGPAPTPATDGAGGSRAGWRPRPEVLAPLEEVSARLGDPGVAIIDARTPEEYAKGHIPGAININYPANALPDSPNRWKPAAELRVLYEEAGIRPDQRVIPYCSSGVRSAVTFFTLRLIGYEDVGLYTGSWQEWGARPELPKVTGARP